MLFVGAVLGLLGLQACAVEVSKEVDVRWLLERCLSTLGYVCGEFFHFANSKTSSPLPPSASPKVTLHKKANSQMILVYFYYYFFNYCFADPMLQEVCLVFSGAEGTACVCLLTPSSRAAAWKLSQLLTSHFPFSFPDFCMCGVWNPGDCLWSLVGVWKCVRTSSPRRYDVQKCAFGYPAAWFKWLQSLTETLPPSLATLWLLFHSVNLVLSKPKVSIKFLEK